MQILTLSEDGGKEHGENLGRFLVIRKNYGLSVLSQWCWGWGRNADGTKGTRIVTNRYYFDGYWWDEIIFDNGSKGFVATNYLKKID